MPDYFDRLAESVIQTMELRALQSDDPAPEVFKVQGAREFLREFKKKTGEL
jgi:hypothetical protein